jgi:hypothetical protein
MELLNNLASVGLSIGVLQIAIVIGVVAFIVGMFWQYFAIGLGVLFCAVVLAMPAKTEKEVIKEQPKIEAVVPKVEEEKVPEKVPNSGESLITERELFLGDCVVYGGLPQKECEMLWEERNNWVEPAKLTKKWKKEYFQKVNQKAKNGRV